jgi:hypothetical protein
MRFGRDTIGSFLKNFLFLREDCGLKDSFTPRVFASCDIKDTPLSNYRFENFWEAAVFG